MELIPLDDEEPILTEEKTKQEETNRRKKEPVKNKKHGTPSVKGAMRERSEKAQTTLEETRVDTRKQRRKPSQKQKEPQLARSTKWTQTNNKHKNLNTMPEEEMQTKQRTR